MIDAHVHVWEPGDGHRVLIRERIPALDADFGFPRLLPELSAAGIQRVVLVSAAQSFAETQRLLQVAERFREQIAGVIGFLDLDSDDFGAALEMACAQPGLVGLRLPLVVYDDPDWIGRPRVSAALGQMSDRGLIAQVLAAPVHLFACASALAAHRDLVAVIDHAGNPGPQHLNDTVWRDGIAALGRGTSALCKVGDFAPAAALIAEEDRCVAILGHVVNSFGTDRLLYGSNWPVSTLHKPYPAVARDLQATAIRLGLDIETLNASMRRNALRLCARDVRHRESAYPRESRQSVKRSIERTSKPWPM